EALPARNAERGEAIDAPGDRLVRNRARVIRRRHTGDVRAVARRRARRWLLAKIHSEEPRQRDENPGLLVERERATHRLAIRFEHRRVAQDVPLEERPVDAAV